MSDFVVGRISRPNFRADPDVHGFAEVGEEPSPEGQAGRMPGGLASKVRSAGNGRQRFGLQSRTTLLVTSTQVYLLP